MARYAGAVLQPGGSAELSFALETDAMAVANTDGHRVLQAGEYDIVFTDGHEEQVIERPTTAPGRAGNFRCGLLTVASNATGLRPAQHDRQRRPCRRGLPDGLRALPSNAVAPLHTAPGLFLE